MTGHTRLQHTLRSPHRARTLHKRARRQRALAAMYAEVADVPEEVRPRLLSIRKRASLTPGSQLRALFPSRKAAKP